MALAFPALLKDGRKRFVWNSPEWWEWFTAFRRKPSTALIQRRLAEYESFISFHSARPVDVASYYEKGLELAQVEKLNAQARERLLSSRYGEITSAILERAITEASIYHDQTLFLVLDEREISGHYLIYGSEHICGIAASMTREAGLDCRQLLKNFGTPTVFRVALPPEIIPGDQIHELAEYLRESSWEERKRVRPPMIDFSFILKQPVAAEHILDHVHPESIPDPLLFNYPYSYRDNFPNLL
jgi:hypothetical protein